MAPGTVGLGLLRKMGATSLVNGAGVTKAGGALSTSISLPNPSLKLGSNPPLLKFGWNPPFENWDLGDLENGFDAGA